MHSKMRKRMKQLLTLSLFGLFFNACSNEKQNDIERIVDEYYSTYNERQDVEKFLGFYDDKILFEDIINGDRIEGKSELKNFLDWENVNFKLLEDNSLRITETIIQGNKAVVKGYFTPFQWGEHEFESMHFTTILTFADNYKIIRQVDWINYPSDLVNYDERKNSNDWIDD